MLYRTALPYRNALLYSTALLYRTSFLYRTALLVALMSGAGEETVAKLLELGEHPDTADDVSIVRVMSV